MKLKDKNLLIISSYFPDKKNTFIGGIFVKRQLEYIKKKFKRVEVIALTTYLPKALTKLGLYRHRTKQIGLRNYTYDNVHVHFVYFPVIPTNFFRKYSRKIAFFIASRYIERKNIRFDIIHAHFTHPSGYVAVKLKEKYKKPTILTVHEDSSFLQNEINRNDSMLNESWKKSDFIIRVNKRDVLKLKKFNKNVINIPNGFNKKVFHPIDKNYCREKLNLPKYKKIILSISILAEQKGFKYSIEAMKYVVERDKNVLYLIGGQGPLKNSLEKQIKDLGLGNYVKLIGFVPSDKISLYMNACDFFLLPSLNEGNPTVMFETIGCGKPFIGTSVGGVPEIIINNKLGILSKPRDIKTISKNVLLAFKKEWDSNYIVNYAEQFTWENIAKEILKVYEKVLE